jgi:hypothetical protein
MSCYQFYFYCIRFLTFGLIFLGSFLFYQIEAYGFQGCVLLKTDVNEYSEQIQSQVSMQKGRILPFRNYDGEKKTLEVLYKQVWIPLSSKYAMMGSKSLCSVEPVCAVSTGVTKILKKPGDKSSSIVVAYEDQKFPFLGRQSFKSEVWAQIDLGDKIGWIDGKKIRLENKACGLSQVGKSSWSLEFEVKKWNPKKIEEFEKLFFWDSNQDLNTARDPIYRVHLIDSQSLAMHLVYSKDSHGFSSGIGYHQRVWRYKEYSDFRQINPLPPNNCELRQGDEGDAFYSENFVLIPLSYRYQIFSRQNHLIRARPQIDILYSIEPNYLFSFHSPCRQAGTVKETSNTFQAHGFLNLDYLYRFEKWEVGLSLGVEHTSALTMSLLVIF